MTWERALDLLTVYYIVDSAATDRFDSKVYTAVVWKRDVANSEFDVVIETAISSFREEELDHNSINLTLS